MTNVYTSENKASSNWLFVKHWNITLSMHTAAETFISTLNSLNYQHKFKHRHLHVTEMEMDSYVERASLWREYAYKVVSKFKKIAHGTVYKIKQHTYLISYYNS